MSVSAAAPVEVNALRILPWIVGIVFFMQMLDATILNTTLDALHYTFLALAILNAPSAFIFIRTGSSRAYGPITLTE